MEGLPWQTNLVIHNHYSTDYFPDPILTKREVYALLRKVYKKIETTKGLSHDHDPDPYALNLRQKTTTLTLFNTNHKENRNMS
jgi:hypothetical protein